VNNLLADVTSPVLCFSDPLIFFENKPGTYQRLSDALKLRPPAVMEEQRMFLCFPCTGHTFAFTRPLREMYLRHKDIAHSYAYGHDWWMYYLAVAAGTHRWLSNVPTTLYRQHGSNVTAFMSNPGGIGLSQILRIQQFRRPLLARQAEGFLLASRTLPPSDKLHHLVSLARIVATINRRQSLTTLIRLARQRAFWPDLRTALCFAALCLFSSAKSSSKVCRPGVSDSTSHATGHT
jgi:hypothetical protein